MSLDELIRGLITAGATTVLIDGRSGAGKSTLADQWQRHWPASSVVRLDDIYPGWDGLAWAVAHVRTQLLEPRADGRPGRWRQWNWVTGTAGSWHTVEPDRRLIVEGVGALTQAHRALADLGIWVHTPDDVRRRRALERDGDTYRPHWDRWAAQEDRFVTECAPRRAADYIAVEAAAGSSWTFRRQ